MSEIFNFNERYIHLCSYYWDKEDKKVYFITEAKKTDDLPDEIKEKMDMLKEAEE